MIIFPKSRILEKLFYSYPVCFFIIYLLFLINIVASGSLFSNVNFPAIVFTIILLISLYVNRQKLKIKKEFFTRNKKYLIFLAIVVVVYSLPILLSAGGIVWIGGDMRYHIGWTAEILLGKPISLGLQGDTPELYPWMFHAALAFFGSFFRLLSIDQMRSIFLAYDCMGIITIIFGFISIASFSSALFKNRSSMVLISTFLSLFSAGFGFFLYGGEANISSIMGDMMINFPYSSSLFFVLPQWPRDTSFAFFIASIYLLLKITGPDDGQNKIRVAMLGIVLGLCGMIETIPCLLALGVMGLLFLFDLIKGRINYPLMFSAIIAVLMILPWAIPFVIAAFKYGMASNTKMSPIDLSPLELFVALGQVSILSLCGLYLYVKKKNDYFDKDKIKIMNVFVIVLLIIIIASSITTYLGLDISLFFVPILRQHKYWGILYLFLSMYSTIAVYAIIEFLENKGKRFSFGAYLTLSDNVSGKNIDSKFNFNIFSALFILLLLILGAGSPIVTSYKTATFLSQKTIVNEFSNPAPNELMLTLLTNLTKSDVVATPVSEAGMTRYLSSFTGASVVYISVNRTKVMAGSEDVPSDEERINDLTQLYSNRASKQEKIDVIKKYKITYIISTTERLGSFKPLTERSIKTTFQKNDYYILVVNSSAIYGP
jgi:hypothetical protein